MLKPLAALVVGLLAAGCMPERAHPPGMGERPYYDAACCGSGLGVDAADVWGVADAGAPDHLDGIAPELDAGVALDAGADAVAPGLDSAAQPVDMGALDAGHDAAMPLPCACTSGPCCDGCDFRPAGYDCGPVLHGAACSTTLPVGLDLDCGQATNRISRSYWSASCSGDSAACTVLGSWVKSVSGPCDMGLVCLGDHVLDEVDGGSAECVVCPL